MNRLLVLQALVAGAVVAGMLLAIEVGYRVGRRHPGYPQGASGLQIGTIQGSMLGLLGLLLAFSFGGAAARFIERQDLITGEANALSAAYLRADLLDEPYRTRLKTALAEYVDHRVKVTREIRLLVPAGALAEAKALQARIWEAARDGVSSKPVTMLPVLDPVNDVMDLHALRVAAGEKHLPRLVLALLVTCSALALGVIGFACGLVGRRNVVMTWSLALILAGALWTTIDLDHPRMGLIRLKDASLEDLDFRETP